MQHDNLRAFLNHQAGHSMLLGFAILFAIFMLFSIILMVFKWCKRVNWTGLLYQSRTTFTATQGIARTRRCLETYFAGGNQWETFCTLTRAVLQFHGLRGHLPDFDLEWGFDARDLRGREPNPIVFVVPQTLFPQETVTPSKETSA
ncbi:hypothetical protein FRC03_003258 [Tulasnella sp. 419]|nr:hypothetical protein FRC03_003258 [Tulasnella sp. 419]